MFFISLIVNYQAFIEHKSLIQIKSLTLNVEKFEQVEKDLIGELKITSVIYTNNLETETSLEENLTFKIEKIEEEITELKIEDFNYQIVEGRGIELELDFNLISDVNDIRNIKEEIEQIKDEELKEILSVEKEYLEKIKEDRTFQKSRKTFRF